MSKKKDKPPVYPAPIIPEGFKPPKNKGGAPFGNKNNTMFETPAERQAAFDKYCDHLAKGYSSAAFYDPCTSQTIDNLRKRHPTEFDEGKLKAARAQGVHLWETMGMAGAAGKLKNFNPSAWIFNVKNRLGWKDRQELGLDKPTRAVFKLKMGKTMGDQQEEDDAE